MACRLVGTKPLFVPIVPYRQWDPWERMNQCQWDLDKMVEIWRKPFHMNYMKINYITQGCPMVGDSIVGECGGVAKDNPRCFWYPQTVILTPFYSMKCEITETITKNTVFEADIAWWRHQMERFSALLAICAGNSPVPGEFPAQRPVTRSFDVCFDLRLNKRLSKQSWGWWFETQSRPLWRHSNGVHKSHSKSV